MPFGTSYIYEEEVTLINGLSKPPLLPHNKCMGYLKDQACVFNCGFLYLSLDAIKQLLILGEKVANNKLFTLYRI